MLRPRIDASPAVLAAAAGDVVIVALFVLAGEFRHYPTVEMAVARWPGTLWPFLVGWGVVGTLVGAFTEDAFASPREAAVLTAVGWVGADVLAQAIRAFQPARNADVAFFLVAAVFGVVLLGAWRAIAAYVV